MPKTGLGKSKAWKELLTEEEDCLGKLVGEHVQQVLEGEMEEALRAEKVRADGVSGWLSEWLLQNL